MDSQTALADNKNILDLFFRYAKIHEELSDEMPVIIITPEEIPYILISADFFTHGNFLPIICEELEQAIANNQLLENQEK